MLPHDLKPEQFSGYPPEARKLVINHLSVLQRLPLSFLPSVLREAIEYDYKFPPERKALDGELVNLSSLSAEQLKEWLHGFTQIQLSATLENFDWINLPAQFVEHLASHLWTTGQLDAFRLAATAYADHLHAAVPPEPPAAPRLGITVIGQGVPSYDGPLFQKLRAHGAYYSRVNPENGLQILLDALTARAKMHPASYAHWYIDGGKQVEHNAGLSSVSYGGLAAPRAALLEKMRAEIDRPGMGPEALRTYLARLRPGDLGFTSGDEVLDRFRIKMLTEGSGTQIFSTTFVQWTTREALRRAQPLTLLARFAPRQRQRPMNEMLAETGEVVELDPAGSLVDAEIGAYYHWLNQMRLSGATESAFLVWFEDKSHALAIGPTTPRATTSNSAIDLAQILASLA